MRNGTASEVYHDIMWWLLAEADAKYQNCLKMAIFEFDYKMLRYNETSIIIEYEHIKPFLFYSCIDLLLEKKPWK